MIEISGEADKQSFGRRIKLCYLVKIYQSPVLEGLNQLAPRLRVQAISDDFSEWKISSLNELSVIGAGVPQEEFINSKLTLKLAWCCENCLLERKMATRFYFKKMEFLMKEHVKLRLFKKINIQKVI